VAPTSRVGTEPVWRKGRILAVDLSDVPGERRWCIVLHSRAGTTVRMNVPIGYSWRIPIKDGHHAVVTLERVREELPPVTVAGALFAYPAVVSFREPVDCPGCSGLSKGSAAAAVQRQRARGKLAKQRGIE